MSKLHSLDSDQIKLIEHLGLKVELKQLQEKVESGAESENSAITKLTEMLEAKILPVSGNELFFDHRGSYFGEEAKRRIMLGTYVSSAGYYDAYYNQAQKVRELARQDFVKAFDEVDLCLTATSPEFPFKIGQKSNDPLKMYLSDVFTCGINPVRIPGLNVPIGFFPIRKDEDSENPKLSAGSYAVIILSNNKKYLLEGFEMSLDSKKDIQQKAEFGFANNSENLLEILGTFEKNGQKYAVLYFEDLSEFGQDQNSLKKTDLAKEFIEQNIVYLPAGIQILGPEQSENKVYDLGEEIEEVVNQEYR